MITMRNRIPDFSLYLFILLLVSVLTESGHAQSLEILPPFQFVDNDKIPKDLLSERSVVILRNAPDNWKEVCQKIHNGFRKMGVDAVSYYRSEDLDAGFEVLNSQAEMFSKRMIKYLILFEFNPGQADLYVTAFNGRMTFYDIGQAATVIRSGDVQTLLTVLNRMIGQENLKPQSYLITEYPEFLGEIDLIAGNRNESVARDLKLDKLAVFIPEKLEVIAGSPDAIEYNRRIDADSAKISEIFRDYPFQYEIIPYQADEETLRNLGFHFILYSIHNSGRQIKTLLDYPVNASETDYLTVSAGNGKPGLKSIPVTAGVYKYYVKHIYTKDIFLGNDWDADQDWEVALRNYLAGIRRAIPN